MKHNKKRNTAYLYECLVKELTKAIVRKDSDKKSKIVTNSSNLRDLENILEKKLGIRVLIKNKKNNSGSIIFDYRDLDQLNRLIEIIKSNY